MMDFREMYARGNLSEDEYRDEIEKERLYGKASDHMSNPDAVRPTGETGARCPWCGSEMRSIPFPTSWAARCTNPKCYAIGPQHRENPFDALAAAARPREQLGPRMPWSDMSGSEKEAVYNNAPRPLPDFPAGEFPECAPGPWGIDPDGLDTRVYDANGDSIVDTHPGFLNAEQSAIRDFILSRVNNAPARPAAAGVTTYGGISEEEELKQESAPCEGAEETAHKDARVSGKRASCPICGSEPHEFPPEADVDERQTWVIRCENDGFKGSPEERLERAIDGSGPNLTHQLYVFGDTREEALSRWNVLAHAESLLSSRATGAEVEIVIEEPSEEEISGIARTILENSVMSEMQLMTLAVERGYQLARRHATMRGGGE